MISGFYYFAHRAALAMQLLVHIYHVWRHPLDLRRGRHYQIFASRIQYGLESWLSEMLMTEIGEGSGHLKCSSFTLYFCFSKLKN